MRIHRLVTFVAAFALVYAEQTLAQPRPVPRSRSRTMFGDRPIGWPVQSVPRDYQREGTFGVRSNFGRGMTPPQAFDIWSDLPNLPSPSNERLDTANVGPADVPDQAAPMTEQAPGPLEAEQAIPFRTPPTDQVTAELGSEAMGPSLEAPTKTVNSTTPPSSSNQREAGAFRGVPFEVAVAHRLQRILGGRLRSPLRVTLRGGTAVLEGVVATARDRDLAGHLARFEPGIQRVDNELIVAGTSETRSAN